MSPVSQDILFLVFCVAFFIYKINKSDLIFLIHTIKAAIQEIIIEKSLLDIRVLPKKHLSVTVTDNYILTLAFNHKDRKVLKAPNF